MSVTLERASALEIALRGRRLRRTRALRGLVRETRLHAEMLVQPIFIQAGATDREPIGTMPGQDRLGLGALPGWRSSPVLAAAAGGFVALLTIRLLLLARRLTDK